MLCLSRVLPLLLGLSVAAPFTPLESDAPPRKEEKKKPICLRWHMESRYRGIGYDHVVHFASACKADATCAVTTNVNPKRTEARVPAGKATSVVTFLGSPAATFRATVACDQPSAPRE